MANENSGLKVEILDKLGGILGQAVSCEDVPAKQAKGGWFSHKMLENALVIEHGQLLDDKQKAEVLNILRDCYKKGLIVFKKEDGVNYFKLKID